MEYQRLMKSPKYRQLHCNYYAKKIGKLAQGMSGLVEGTNKMFFIKKKYTPVDRWREVTYWRVVVDYRPEKSDPYLTTITVGGYRVNHPGDCGTPTMELTTVKILLNIVVSTPNAKFMTIDIKYFYLNTPMEMNKYMRLKISNPPESVVQKNNLEEKVTKYGYVNVEIMWGVYGLPQAGIIAQQLIEQQMNKKGYKQSDINPEFWTHKWCPI